MRLHLGLIFVLCTALSLEAKKHPHQGKLPSYIGEPPSISLSKSEQAQVDKGEPVYLKVKDGRGSGGLATAVFKVNAPPERVWRILKNFESYPKWIPELQVAEVYKREDNNVFGHFYYRKNFFIKAEYYIKHVVSSEPNRWITWTLDYDNRSDFHDNVGFWKVREVANNPNICIVDYQIQIKLKGFKNLLVSFVETEGLKEATAWLRPAAESREASVSSNTPKQK